MLTKLIYSMADAPTKKLLKKIDKTIPGFSNYFDPKKLFHLKENEGTLLDVASSLLLMVDAARRTSKGDKKNFSEIAKQVTRIIQNFLCARCGKPLGEVYDFHHVDGNRSNNDISNCEALCMECHAKLTRGISKIRHNGRLGRKVAKMGR